MEGASEVLIFGIGNPLLDISVETPNDEIFKKYELSAGQACLAEEKHMPLYDELWKTAGVETIPGGSALNSMRAANFMLKETLPGKVAYFGCIGKDEKGDVLEKITIESGLQARFHRDEATPTGTCAVIVHDKERTLVANLAACLKYPLDHLKANMDLLEKAKVIYTTSFFITANFEALIETCKYANSANKPLGLNLSAVFLLQFETAKVLEAIEHADYVFCNEDEAAAYAKAREIDGSDLKNVAIHIAKAPKKNDKRPRVAIVTQGADPVLCAIKHADKEDCEMLVVEVPKLSKEQIVDTNGAGDAFVGGFLSQLVQDKDLETCVKAGSYASSEIIQRSGCTFPDKVAFKA